MGIGLMGGRDAGDLAPLSFPSHATHADMGNDGRSGSPQGL